MHSPHCHRYRSCGLLCVGKRMLCTRARNAGRLGWSGSRPNGGRFTRRRSGKYAHKKEVIIEPIGGVAAEPNPKLQGKEAWAQQEAADRADEEKLTKKLMICSKCEPAPAHEDATDHSER